eukprot:365619-Chlamydomonas_euryale.AAC.16
MLRHSRFSPGQHPTYLVMGVCWASCCSLSRSALSDCTDAAAGTPLRPSALTNGDRGLGKYVWLVFRHKQVVLSTELLRALYALHALSGTGVYINASKEGKGAEKSNPLSISSFDTL